MEAYFYIDKRNINNLKICFLITSVFNIISGLPLIHDMGSELRCRTCKQIRSKVCVKLLVEVNN